DASKDGTTTSLLLCPATHSSSPSVLGISPLRTEQRIETLRTSSRPERHVVDSFITIRRAIARAIASRLPRCPYCHRRNPSPPRPLGASASPRSPPMSTQCSENTRYIEYLAPSDLTQ